MIKFVKLRENEDVLKLLEKEKNIYLLFSANYCKFCKKIKECINDLIRSSLDLNVYILEIVLDEFDNFKYRHIFKIDVLPTILIFKNGQEFKRRSGDPNFNDLVDFFKY